MQGPGEAAKGVASSRADRLRRGGRHPHDKRLGVEYIVWQVDFLLALGATLCGMAGPASSCMRHPCGVGAYEIDAAGIVTGTGVDELDDLERLGGPSWARLLSHPVLSNSQRLSFVGKSPVSLVKRLKSAESDLRDRRRPRPQGPAPTEISGLRGTLDCRSSATGGVPRPVRCGRMPSVWRMVGCNFELEMLQWDLSRIWILSVGGCGLHATVG